MKKMLSLNTIELGLKDSDCDVRQAAMIACQKNGINIPRWRYCGSTYSGRCTSKG